MRMGMWESARVRMGSVLWKVCAGRLRAEGIIHGFERGEREESE